MRPHRHRHPAGFNAQPRTQRGIDFRCHRRALVWDRMQQVSPNDAAAKMAPKAASLLALLGPAVAQLPSDFHTASRGAAALDGEFRAHGDFDRDGDVDLLQFSGDVSGW